MTNSPVRWGVAGTGQIAATLAAAVHQTDGGELVAVGSRARSTADAFAAAHDVPRAHASYEALAANPDVDAIIVATPAHRHRDDVIAFLAAGKHVVCEKPLGLNRNQVAEMAEAARRSGRFLMEAIWSRFLPSYRRLVELLGGGAIGEPLLVEASLGSRMPFDPTARLFDLAQAGGALLDLGIYPVQLAHQVFGPPTSVTAQTNIGATGVDEITVVTMTFPGGGQAVATAAISAALSSTARIMGTEGVIELPHYMHCPTHLVLDTAAGREQLDLPYGKSPWSYEIDDANRAISSGALESETMPLADSVAIISTLDTARAAIGLRYPQET